MGLIRCLHGALEKLYAGVAVPGESDEDVHRKKMLINTQLGVAAVLVFMIGHVVMDFDGSFRMKYIAWLWATMVTASTIAYVFMQKAAPVRLVEAWAWGMSISILLVDLGFAAGMKPRSWPWFVVVVDVLLVARARTSASVVLVIAVCVWLVVTQIEHDVRFGLFDLPGLPPYSVRRGYCGCEHPPCALASGGFSLKGYGNLLFVSSTFVLDFLITRGFARQVQLEKENVEAAIEAADGIACALAKFDLAKARKQLKQQHHTVPPGLRDAFERILHNLQDYRPFLPTSLFEMAAESAFGDDLADDEYAAALRHQVTRSPPGRDAASPEIAVVVLSAALDESMWDCAGAVMSDAIRRFSTTVRKLVARHNGYESKSCGDEFVVAFDDAASAVRFASDMHVTLLEIEWPDELLLVKQCEPDPFNLWRGLAAKIAVEFGVVSAHLNELTGRCSYRGPLVVQAHRHCRACPRGATVVAQAIVHNPTFLPSKDALSLMSMSPLEAYLAVPVELTGRSADLAPSESLMSAVSKRESDDVNPLDSLAFDFADESPPTSSAFSSLTSATTSVSATSIFPAAAVPAGPSVLLSPPQTHDKSGSFEECFGTTAQVHISIRQAIKADPATFEARLGTTLSFFMMHVDLTHGTVVSLNGSSLVITWNVFTACESHVRSALRFVGGVSAHKAKGRGSAFPRGPALTSDGYGAAGTFGLEPPRLNPLLAAQGPRNGGRQAAVYSLRPQSSGSLPALDLNQSLNTLNIGEQPAGASTEPASASSAGHNKLKHTFHIGVSNGRMLYGSVGCAKQKFITAVGYPATLAQRLATAAQTIGVAALLAAAPDQPCAASLPQYRSVTRPIDKWRVGNTHVVVYQIQTGAQHDTESQGRVSWMWSDEYRSAFKSKDVSRLDAMACKDPVLDHVCDLLSKQQHLVYKHVEI
eukprot:TRINITY_DN3408_c0_g1_i7.p1 TRINITY_DN3408_c0_g1~~TRINITY_DN3408_c0_g1_i7.p1  ORF type:complete len:928 (+),score=273.50 TRINITY_DN3408_c0_g1_i7:102-2885(+)